MRARPTTPPLGSLITIRAKTHDALVSAAARQVEAIKFDHHPSEPVLVVYGDHAASVFCAAEAIRRRNPEAVPPPLKS